MKLNYFSVLLFLLLSGCTKEEMLQQDPAKIVDLEMKGLVMTDTLEFVLNDKVICTAIDGTFQMTNDNHLFRAGGIVSVRKKDGLQDVGQFELNESPFKQVKKIFYDGNQLSDNVELTPISSPENIGMRFRFSTKYPGFYGGPVDIELFDYSVDPDTFATIYTPLNIVIKNVTGAFSNFIELPPPPEGHSYSFKVYKKDTKQLPFNDSADLSIIDPESVYGYILFYPGQSQLLTVDIFYDGMLFFGEYNITDNSGSFK